MEVKHGYKQTEVGVIPEEWDAAAIGSLVKLQGGYSFRSENFCDIGVPVIRISDIQDGAVATEKAICHPPVKISSEFLIHEGDFLVAMSGATTGKVGVFRKQTLAYQNQRVGRFVVRDKTRTSSEFVGHLVRSHAFGSRLKALLEQGAQPNVSGRQIESLLFPVPPSPAEQRAIAEALSDIDGLLGGLDRLIAKKHDLRQAAMQQLLTGQTRLPGFHGDWVTKELGQLGKLAGAGVDKKIRPDEPPVRLVNYMNVYSHNFIQSKDLDHVVSASVEQAARCVVRKGDIFFTPSSEMPFDIAASAVAVEDIPDACYSYHVVRLRLDEDWDLNFRAYAFKTQNFLNQAAKVCEGSGVRYVITQGKFRQLTVCFPIEKTEQAAIAEVLTDMDAELAALERRREKTRALKQAMMHELLTGKTRLL